MHLKPQPTVCLQAEYQNDFWRLNYGVNLLCVGHGVDLTCAWFLVPKLTGYFVDCFGSWFLGHRTN